MAAARTLDKIKEEIEARGEPTRQDIYEVLSKSKGKKDKDKKQDLKDFLETLPKEIKDKKKDGHKVKDKILDDLGSYPA